MSATVVPPPPYPWEMAVYCWPIPVPLSVVPGDGKAFSIGGGQADALMLEKGSSFTLNAGDTATDTTVNGGLFTAGAAHWRAPPR